MLLSPQQVKEGGAADHGGIVGAIGHRRVIEANAQGTQFLLQARPQAGICRYAASQQDLFHVIFLGCQARLDRQARYLAMMDLADPMTDYMSDSEYASRATLRSSMAHLHFSR